jgi:hypothetical protein
MQAQPGHSLVSFSPFGSREFQRIEILSRLSRFFGLLVLLLFFLLFQLIGLLFVILTLILLALSISHDRSPFWMMVSRKNQGAA